MSGKDTRQFFGLPLPSLNDIDAVANLFGFSTPQQLKKAFEELSDTVRVMEREIATLKKEMSTLKKNIKNINKKKKEKKRSSILPSKPL